MIMMEPGMMLEIVEQRQVYLRSIAAQRSSGTIMLALRRSVGHGLIRVGRWVEGCRPEMAAEPKVAESWRSVQVADGAH